MSVRLVPVVEIVEVSDREQEKTLFVPNIDFFGMPKDVKKGALLPFLLSFLYITP